MWKRDICVKELDYSKCTYASENLRQLRIGEEILEGDILVLEESLISVTQDMINKECGPVNKALVNNYNNVYRRGTFERN